MSSRPEVRWSQLRTAMLPDLLISLVGPVLIYRVAVSSLPATEALLLAGPIVRYGVLATLLLWAIFFARRRRSRRSSMPEGVSSKLEDEPITAQSSSPEKRR